MSIVRNFKIGGKLIEVTFNDENQVDKYLDLDEFESNWHRYKIGEYHFSSLLYCLLDYFFNFQYEREITNLQKKGIFWMGSLLHKKIQDFMEKFYGFVVIERPLVDDLEVKFTHDGVEYEEDIRIIGKVDVLEVLTHITDDIKSTRYMPVFDKISEESFEEKYAKYIIQVFAYACYLNNTYYKIDPIKKLRILLINKPDAYIKTIEVKYDEEVGVHFYNKIRNRAKHLHICLMKKTPPKAEINQYCTTCTNLSLCNEGTEYAESLKTPVDFKTVAFKSKFPEKKAYIKRSGEWKQTKAFVKFCEELDKKEKENEKQK